MKKEWNIFFLLFECVEVLDFSGPFDVFSMANIGVEDGQGPNCTEPGRVFKLHTISEDGCLVTALHGLRIQPDYSFENCPNDEIDVLIIPGSGTQVIQDFIKNHPEVVQWVAKRSQHVPVVASVCVGALILGEAGVFDGPLQVTTHHAAISNLNELLKKRGSKAEVIPGARYVDNPDSKSPRVLSSAGVSAGMDMAYYMLWKIFGEDDATGEALARNTATIMEYNGTANWAFGKFKPVVWQ